MLCPPAAAVSPPPPPLQRVLPGGASESVITLTPRALPAKAKGKEKSDRAGGKGVEEGGKREREKSFLVLMRNCTQGPAVHTYPQTRRRGRKGALLASVISLRRRRW